MHPLIQTLHCPWLLSIALSAATLVPGIPLHPHDLPGDIEVGFRCRVGRVAGTLRIPESDGAVPCVVISGGSLSHTRDGGFLRPGAPERDALERLAVALDNGGYASLRFDRMGYGMSQPNENWKGTYADEATVLSAALNFARSRKQLGKVIVAGESAGGYLACLTARNGNDADGYLFLGAHCGPGEEIYEYNFGGLVEYAGGSPERHQWACEHLRHELALGRHYAAIFQAARAGRSSIEIQDGDYTLRYDSLQRRREELESPPDELFRCIRAPTLVLAGAKDLNVRPSHVERIVARLRAAGNDRISSALIPDSDHSFQRVPHGDDLRYRQRYTFESFRNSYSPLLYRTVLDWLWKTFPTPTRRDVSSRELVRIATVHPPRPEEPTRITPKTASSPERLHLAPGVVIVEDFLDEDRTAGVETLEGRIGPLLLAEGCQAHFITMRSGMYVEEHPHSSESIIFTVRGKWVLSSGGRRHVMKPGTLFTFGVDVPTGYEVPFKKDATILIFKGDRLTKVEREFIDYLKGLERRLQEDRKEGIPFHLRSLPDDHPARVFAREVSPDFEASLR